MSEKPRIFHFHNRFHLGDNLLNLKFLYNIRDTLREHRIHIYYYYDTGYIYNTLAELNVFVDPTTLTLHDCSKKVPESIELWQSISINGISCYQFDTFYNALYTKVLRTMSIPVESINTSLWQDEPYLSDIYDTLNDRYKNIDILIINNRGNSGQYNSTKALNALCVHLNTKFNIVVTTHISDEIKSTNDTFTVRDYGAISTHCKYIISVFSGTNSCLFNSKTKESVKKWFMIEDCMPHRIDSIDCTFTNSIGEIREYFDSLVV